MRRVLFVPDTHVPFHDRQAFALMVQVAHDIRPDVIVIMGDFADCWAVSSHPKDPARRDNLADEVAAVRVALDQLDAVGAKVKHYIAGNHEDRLARYIQTRAPEMFGLVDIPTLLDLPARGWRWTPYRNDVRIGKAYVTHDIGVAGRTAIFRNLDAYQANVLTGHTHRLAWAVEGSARGDTHVTASFGWLGDANQLDYMHRARAARDWSLGFGLGYLERSGTLHVTPVPIVNGRCVVEGQLFYAGAPRRG